MKEASPQLLNPPGEEITNHDDLVSSIPNRWSPIETSLLSELRVLCSEEIAAAKPFPEVVGDRRLMRFLRGHNYDVKKAASKLKSMLAWRKENNIDAIREDIVTNKKYHPHDFPYGELILKLYPMIAVSPLCATDKGLPLSYESYDFSPTKVLYELGSTHNFINFHIYCEELKHIVLDNVSNAHERQKLAYLKEKQDKQEMLCSNGENEGGGGGEEEYWGEVVRLVVVRDLRGFGLEHASKPARELIKKVITISQDNYPEQMDICYLVNVPWVFNCLWQALQPIISSWNTRNKVLIWDSNFLQALRHEVPLSQLPKMLGGHVDAYKYTTEEMDTLLFRGEFSDNVKPYVCGLAMSQENSESSQDDDDETGYSSDESSSQSSSSTLDGSDFITLKGEKPDARITEWETSKRAVEFQSFEVDEALEMTIKMYDQHRSKTLPDAKGRRGNEFEYESMLADDYINNDDQVNNWWGGEGGIMQWWGNRRSNIMNHLTKVQEDPLDIFTPRTKRRCKRELAGRRGTESSCSSNVDALDHYGEGGRNGGSNSNSIQQHLDHMTRQSRQRKKGAKVATPDKHSSLMCISEGDLTAWVPNSHRPSCLHCERQFNVLRRRHHCRMCGEVVCAECSPHRVALVMTSAAGGLGSNGKPRHDLQRRSSIYKRKREKEKTVAVRVCADCFKSLQSILILKQSRGDVSESTIDKLEEDRLEGSNNRRTLFPTNAQQLKHYVQSILKLLITAVWGFFAYPAFIISQTFQVPRVKLPASRKCTPVKEDGNNSPEQQPRNHHPPQSKEHQH